MRHLDIQVAFTTAELREMVRLPQCRPVLNKGDFEGLEEFVKSKLTCFDNQTSNPVYCWILYLLVHGELSF